MSDELAEIRVLFFEECDELLVSLDRHLTAFEAGQVDRESINGAFRAIHSIKGGAGAFGLTQLIGFAHAYETALDAVRSDRLALTPEVVAVLRRAGDELGWHIEAAKGERAARDVPELRAELQALAGPSQDVDPDQIMAGAAAPPSSPAPAPLAAAVPSSEPVLLQLVIQPRPDVFRRAVEPALLFAILRDQGRLKVEVDTGNVPALGELDPGDCWLAWRLQLETTSDASGLAKCLEPFLDDDEFTISGGPVPSSAPAAARRPLPAAETGGRATDAAESDAAKPLAGGGGQPAAAVPPAGNTATPAAAATAAAANAGAAAGAAGGAAADARGGSIRVEINRIDRLVNLVGEIVVVQALLAEQTPALDANQHSTLVDAVAALSRRSRELHEAVMAVRAQPVKTVFQRMPRLVRELNQMLDKQARLILKGEQTEVDKTIIEELVDPLTHMIRNSMDHGLEMPDERIAGGKTPEGTIELAAEHRGGRINITVTDDGRGINRDKLLAKAVSRGLVAESARLAPEEIDALIFHPGLSTADKLSDVSGRGVGMDVVKRSIQAMGGRITVLSEPGRGCRFTLAMPLTLAVLDGMVVRVDTNRYVVPLQSVVETLRVGKQKVERLPSGQTLIRLRDRLAPLLDLRALLGHPSGRLSMAAEADAIAVVAETDTGQRMAMLADEILGQQQVVVKSLEQSYGTIRGISGASILGDGRVSLILDVDSLPQLVGPRAFEAAAMVHAPAETLQ